MMETKISDFHTIFYIPVIQKLDFHLPYVRILGTNHCVAMQLTAFKQRELFHNVLCRRDYAERVVTSFAHHLLTWRWKITNNSAITTTQCWPQTIEVTELLYWVKTELSQKKLLTKCRTIKTGILYCTTYYINAINQTSVLLISM